MSRHHHLTDEQKIAMFWAQIDKTGGNQSCWEWQGMRNEAGYGVFYYKGHNGAYRIAFYLVKGDIPPEMRVMHSCDNPPCCNPTHLSLGTQSENMQDKIAKGRQSRYGAGRKVVPPTFFSGKIEMTCPKCGFKDWVRRFQDSHIRAFFAGVHVEYLCHQCGFRVMIGIAPDPPDEN